SPEISKLQRPARLSLAGALNTWTGQSVASPGHRVGSLQRVFAKLRPVSVQGEPAFAALSLQQRRAVGSPAVLNLLSQALREQGYEAQADVLHRLAASSVAKPQARRPFFWKRAARH